MSTPESPLPWRFEDGSILDGDENQIADFFETESENGKHAVHCVNTHDALVEALKKVQYGLTHKFPDDGGWAELQKEINEALRQAEEGK